MRKNVYWSERLDKDLIQYMEENNFYADFSQAVKSLMRDGIKYRKGEILYANNQNVSQSSLPKPKSPVVNTTPEKPTIDFSDIKTEKKAVELSELEDRLNAL
jgi:hypothetical protein